MTVRSVRQTPIHSLSEFQDVVNDAYSQWADPSVDTDYPFLWFRGQSEDWPLLPGVLRPVDPDHCSSVSGPRVYNEFLILRAFLDLYGNYTSQRFTEASPELFAFMQHHGVPTRLLDWTENAILALYFACVENVQENKDRVVYILNPGRLNEGTTDRKSNYALIATSPFVQLRLSMIGYVDDSYLIPEFWKENPDLKNPGYSNLRLPVAFHPVSKGNSRIAAQRGVFTVHGIDRSPIEETIRSRGTTDYLIKLVVPKNSVCRVRRELLRLGISPRSAYPDIEGLSRELRGLEYTRQEGPIYSKRTDKKAT